MKRSILPIFLAALLVCFGSIGTMADTPLMQQLPADVPMAVILQDISQLEARWDASALGRAGQDPAMKQFIQPMTKLFKAAFEDEYEDSDSEEGSTEPKPGTFEKLMPALSGNVVLMMTDLSLLEADNATNSHEYFLLIAEIGNLELAQEILGENNGMGPFGITNSSEDERNERIEYEVEEFLGANITKAIEQDDEGNELTTAAVSIHNNQLIAGNTQHVRDHIERIEKGADETIQDRPSLRSLTTHAPTADITFLIGLDEIIRIAKNEAEEEEIAIAESATEDTVEMETPPMEPQVAKIFEAMGLDEFGGLALAITLDPTETSLDIVFSYKEQRGLLNLLGAYLPGPVELPKIIPSTAFEAGVANFSVPKAWSAIREMVVAMDPSIGDMIDVQLGELKSATGIDLENNVIGSMGDSIFVARFMPDSDKPGETGLDINAIPQVVGFSIDDQEIFSQGFGIVTMLLGQAGPGFREVEYLDHTFYEITAPGMVPVTEANPNGSQSVSFALTDGYFLLGVGGTESIQPILAQMAEPGPSVWEQPKFKKALATLPEGASAVGASSAFQLGQMMLEAFMTGFNSAMPGDGENLPNGKLPKAEVFAKYFDMMANGFYHQDGEFRMTWRLSSPE